MLLAAEPFVILNNGADISYFFHFHPLPLWFTLFSSEEAERFSDRFPRMNDTIQLLRELRIGEDKEF
jgi:hypothetical protein